MCLIRAKVVVFLGNRDQIFENKVITGVQTHPHLIMIHPHLQNRLAKNDAEVNLVKEIIDSSLEKKRFIDRSLFIL